MATAVAAAAALSVSLKPLPAKHRVCSSNNSRLCFTSFSQSSCLRKTVLYRSSLCRRLRGRPLAVAADQQAEVEQIDEVKEEPSVEENTTAAGETTANADVIELSATEVLLRSYSDAVAANDEETMSNVQGQFEAVQKEKESLTRLVANLTEEVSLTKERLIRLNADFDNFRKRSVKEKEALRDTVKADVIQTLLPMIDNFERAKSSIKTETDGEKKIDTSYQGIYKQFVELMRGLGVAVVETVGKEFNPEVHDAIMREESSEYKEGIVVQEFRRGFMIGGKLLRPAMVKVSAGQAETSTSSEDGDAAVAVDVAVGDGDGDGDDVAADVDSGNKYSKDDESSSPKEEKEEEEENSEK